MELSNEDIVTNLLLKKEILTLQDTSVKPKTATVYNTNPNYDLTHYLKSKEQRIKKINSKYLFVGIDS